MTSGANITRSASCAGLPLTTSMQQSNLLGSDVFVGGASSSLRLNNDSSHTCTVSSTDCTWVWHAGLLYAVLEQPGGVYWNEPREGEPVALTVSNLVREGTEFDITQGDNLTIQG